MTRNSIALALGAVLIAASVGFARQSPVATAAVTEAPAEGPAVAAPVQTGRASKKPDLTVEFSRLFPDRTGIFVEIPHLATLIDQFGGSEPLLQMINERFGDDAKSNKPPVITGRELTAILDSSVAIATVPESAKAVATMSFNERAMVFVVHCSSNDAPAFLRDKLLAPLAESHGATRGTITVRGIEAVVFDELAVATAGRTVVFGARPSVVALIESVAQGGPRIGDEPGYASALAKHAGGQEQLFVFVNGAAMAQSFSQSLGVPGQENEEARSKLAPYDLAMREATRSFFGLNAVLGLATGARVDGNTVKVRYDVEVDRSVNGLVAIVADPPTVQFRAAKYVPDTCGMLQSFSVDPVRIFDLAEQYFGPVQPPPNGKNFAQQVEEIEASIGVNVRTELLPALGREIAFTEGFEVFGSRRGVSTGKEDGPKPVRVALVEVRDREPFRKMVVKTFGQIPGAPPLAAVDYKGAELWELAGFAMAFVEDFGIAGQTDDVRRCVDAFVADTTLAAKPTYQSASSEWLGGAIVATYSSADYDAEQLEASAKAQEELRKQIESGDGPSFDVEQMFAWQAVSTLTNPFGATVLRNATGVNWENSSPLAPISAAYNKLLREWIVDGPRRERIDTSHNTAIGILNLIADAETRYRQKDGRYGSLEELKTSGALDASAGDQIVNELSAYRLEVSSSGTGESSKFTVTATPTMYGRTAKLSLFIDETGLLRGLDKDGATASADDPKYPPDPPAIDVPPSDAIETENYENLDGDEGGEIRSMDDEAGYPDGDPATAVPVDAGSPDGEAVPVETAPTVEAQPVEVEGPVPPGGGEAPSDAGAVEDPPPASGNGSGDSDSEKGTEKPPGLDAARIQVSGFHKFKETNR